MELKGKGREEEEKMSKGTFSAYESLLESKDPGLYIKVCVLDCCIGTVNSDIFQSQF